jgi:hypothetical protein
MRLHRLTSFPAGLLAALLVTAIASPVRVHAAEDGCRGFSWDVARERSLFSGSAATVAAGADSGAAPSLDPAHLYALQLKPIAQVSFVTAPGRKSPDAAGYAGLATLRIPAAGLYRISVDASAWIDVVADGGLMGVRDFQGAHDCAAPRKILLFEFPVPRQVVLQISSAASASLRIGVTPAGR